MQLNSTEISELIKQRIAQFNVVSEAHNEGTIVSVSDGIIRVHGTAEVMQGEMIALPGNRYAIALNLGARLRRCRGHGSVRGSGRRHEG